MDISKPEPRSPNVHFYGPAAAGESLRLSLRVDELERRLKTRTLELETEARAKQRLLSRVAELTKRADELQGTAAILHREAVSATTLSRELDEALDAERSGRAAAEKALAESRDAGEALRAGAARAAQEPDHKRRDAELRDARLHLQALRQKADGQAAHIESLRAELDDRLGRVAEADAEIARLRAALQASESDEASARAGLEAAPWALEAAEDLVRRPAPAEPGSSDPSRREPWQTRDELKFLLWITIGAGALAVVVASALFFKG